MKTSVALRLMRDASVCSEMFSSILMTFLCADISCVETAAAGRRTSGAPPAPRLMPTPPGRPIGRPGIVPPERMSRRGAVPVFAVERGSY